MTTMNLAIHPAVQSSHCMSAEDPGVYRRLNTEYQDEFRASQFLVQWRQCLPSKIRLLQTCDNLRSTSYSERLIPNLPNSTPARCLPHFRQFSHNTIDIICWQGCHIDLCTIRHETLNKPQFQTSALDSISSPSQSSTPTQNSHPSPGPHGP